MARRRGGRGSRLVRLTDVLARLRPDVKDAWEAIAQGRVVVDGRVVDNPASFVPLEASVTVRPVRMLRGEPKLRAALDTFGVSVDGRVALDVGAAAGGFTTVLLHAGARRVYAVDAGHGQLAGALRSDERVVNLESTNVADLDATLVPEPVEVVTVDVSYLSLTQAVAQLGRVTIAPGADLVGLVKPMFELRRATAPDDAESLDAALAAATAGIEAAGWRVEDWIESPVRGAKGAPERLVHARRATGGRARSRR